MAHRGFELNLDEFRPDLTPDQFDSDDEPDEILDMTLQQAEELAANPQKKPTLVDGLTEEDAKLNPADRTQLAELRKLRQLKSDLEKRNENMRSEAQKFTNILSKMAEQLAVLQEKKIELESQLDQATEITKTCAPAQTSGIATTNPVTGEVMFDAYHLDLLSLVSKPPRQKTAPDSDDEPDSLLDASIGDLDTDDDDDDDDDDDGDVDDDSHNNSSNDDGEVANDLLKQARVHTTGSRLNTSASHVNPIAQTTTPPTKKPAIEIATQTDVPFDADNDYLLNWVPEGTQDSSSLFFHEVVAAEASGAHTEASNKTQDVQQHNDVDDDGVV
eukprot:c7394_g1_i1.p1 GENE.c7394_g1_i1~~c7394_g1_i1.p1  ORF type:complete len:330 (+),score=108.82 c7394_g1_i1:18-1007(+)